MGKEAKTNAMRILEREKVPYTAHEYAHEEGRLCARRLQPGGHEKTVQDRV